MATVQFSPRFKRLCRVGFFFEGFSSFEVSGSAGVFTVLTAEGRQDFRMTRPRSPGAWQGGLLLPCRYVSLASASLRATGEAGPWPWPQRQLPTPGGRGLRAVCQPGVAPGWPQQSQNFAFHSGCGSQKLPWQARSALPRSSRDSITFFCGSSQVSLGMKGQTEKIPTIITFLT